MDPTSKGPNLDRAELATQTTIGEVVDLVNDKVGNLVPNGYGQQLDAVVGIDPEGQEQRIDLTQKATGLTEDGDTVNIQVGPMHGGSMHDIVRYRIFPTAQGFQITRNNLWEPDISDLKEAEPDSFIRGVINQGRKIMQDERDAGIAVAYEHEAKELLRNIRNSKPWPIGQPRTRIGENHPKAREPRSWFKGLFRLFS